MKTRKRLCIKFCFTAALFMAVSFYAHSQDLTGIWLTKNGISKIEIYKAKDGLYYGKLIWTKDQSEKAKKFHGELILTGLKQESAIAYEGKAHDPEQDKTYSCTIKVKDANQLDLRGYIGISLIGRTERWIRVSR
ncbi:DUF2147 domain-containing protein [Flavobacterium circumlabens]|uniref:DUF2147 domain-containing protein n=1 Tax=Flavobacterium circumlabens TaxID=2133765 RepID=A0A4Y7UGQ0_9FLAO|nr:DUF2147 domain-containing protein [Flavobacterium circumlabens]TCN60135.1 uncharacterized protein (DUF2147 family) [Flavobacterium circumlabens]TEB45361.1 DUF2147 domain-containing protein [Flavobacterium circumlabens]